MLYGWKDSSRMSNTPGNPGNLLELFFFLEILEICKISCKFSG